MQKKSHLKKLALLGITGGVMLSSQASANVQSTFSQTPADAGTFLAANKCSGGSCGDNDDGKGKYRTDFGGNGSALEEKPESTCSSVGMGQTDKNGNGTQEMSGQTDSISEEDLMSKLDYKGRQTYQGLDEEGKSLARELAGRSCAGHNECKGLNSCASDENECAGKGGCKGQSTCSFKDKNQAIEVAAKKMADKRANL